MGMTNQIPNPNDEVGLVRYLVLIAISSLGMGACWWAAGPSLGLFFGGLLVATFLTPAGVLCGKAAASVGGFIAVVAPVVGVWVLTATKTSNTPAALGEAACVLLTYSIAISGIALILAGARAGNFRVCRGDRAGIGVAHLAGLAFGPSGWPRI